MYIETLFGHQDSITDIDALSNQVCVTSGGRDKTVRNWKIEDESQLIFNAKDLGGNVDSIACVSDSLFVSGSDSGSISLWETGKKKPLFTKTFTHGKGTHESIINDEIISVGYCNWITSLASLPNTDLFASGSCDGKIRFYKISKDRKSFTELFQQDANGFVNSLSFFKKDDQVFLVACLGMEHKMGRWWRVKDAKNCVVVYKLG